MALPGGAPRDLSRERLEPHSKMPNPTRGYAQIAIRLACFLAGAAALWTGFSGPNSAQVPKGFDAAAEAFDSGNSPRPSACSAPRLSVSLTKSSV